MKRRYSHSAFDGEGARRNGARWNSVGTRVAYASDSKALAVLEVLVHVQDSDILSAYSLVGIEIPEALIEVFDQTTLPATWATSPPLTATQTIGDRWIDSGNSVVLAVPSVIIPDSFNYLINPLHHRFTDLTVSQPAAFVIHPRLGKP